MRLRSFFPVVAALAFASHIALAQAPAGAPAGANGQCNDGTYSMDAKKQGACRGHKGVKAWFVASAASATAAPAKPAPASAKVSAAAPAPAPPPAAPTAPAKPSAASATGKKPGPAAEAAARTVAPGGGPGMVWVNTESKVYHCPGATFYGKTKQGQYMTEAAAKAAGAHADHNKPCGK